MSKNIGIIDKRFNPKLEVPFFIGEDYKGKQAYRLSDYKGFGDTIILNYTFQDTLVYEGYSRGRSSAIINLKSTTDIKKYQMFLSEFDYFMKECGFTNKDKLSGRFCFCKKGSNFSLRWLSKNAK